MIQSPYQQNIEIIKGFFKKPIILALSIISFVSIGLNLLMLILNPFASFIQKAVNDYSLQNDSSKFSNGFTTGGSVGITTILFAVTFLLFYIFSKKEDNDLSAPSMMFKVLAIIELVFMCIAILIITAAFIILGIVIFLSANISDAQITSSQLNALTAFFVILLIIIVPIIIVALLSSIAQLQFANSIRKSLNSIYLYRKGATFYGVIHIIFAVFSVILIAFEAFLVLVFAVTQNISLSPIQIICLFTQSAMSIVFNIVVGITAISYSSYIKNVSMKFQTQASSQQAIPEDNPAQTPVVSYQPAATLVDANPYAPQPQAAPIAQQPVPQAPVREDFAQQSPKNEEPAADNQPTQTTPIVEETIKEPTIQEPVQQIETPPQAPVKETIVKKAESNDYPTPRFCTECGKPVGPEDYFCNYCGKEIIRNN